MDAAATTDVSETGEGKWKAINMKKFSDSVDKGIATAFRHWAHAISKRPYLVIFVSTIFALTWATVFVFEFKQELDNDDLFTPKDAPSFDDKDYVDETYGSYTERARVLVRLKTWEKANGHCDDRLLLPNEEKARETIQEYFRLYQEMQEIEIEYDDALYRLNDICIKPEGSESCLVTSVLDLWQYNSSVIGADGFNPLNKINSGNLTTRFELPFDDAYYLGKKAEPDCDQDSALISSNVEAFGMTIIYEYEREEVDGAEIDPQSQKWIEELVSWTRVFSENSILDVFVADSNAVSKESDEQIQEDVVLLTIGYALIIVYTTIVLFQNSCLACKTHLTLVSVIGIGLALMSAFGIATALQVKFNSVVQVLPFLILGLGIDDTFVIMGAYQKTDPFLPVSEKIAVTLDRAGSSIFVTSATDCIAFLFGSYTRLPGVKAFSFYASLAILFDFTYQITFFVAFLVLEARREERYRNGCPNLGIVAFWKENIYCDKPEIASTPPREQEMSARNQDPESAIPVDQVSNSKVWNKMCGEGPYDHKSPSTAFKIVGQYLSRFSLHPLGKIMVILIECGLLTIAIYGCTRVKMDFNYVEMFTPDDSPLKTGYSIEDDFFYGNQRYFSVYTKEAIGGNYFYHQDELRNLKTALENDPFVVPPVRTWYEGYSNWLQSNAFPYPDELINNSVPDAASFNRWLMEYLNTTTGRIYAESLIFSNGTNPQVMSSKIGAFTVDVVDGEQSVDLLDSIRSSIEAAAPSLDPVPFSVSFLFFDGFRVILLETTRNVILAGIGVFIVNLFLLASFSTALIVVSMVGLTDIMILGYMWYVDQSFNPVTAINLVLAVGIAVDYSAHIAHSFLVVTGDRNSRAQQALEHIGAEVLSGAFTTWLGIVVMAVAKHYFFRSFFKMFFAIIVVGAWHGLVFLPVVLSLIGSPPYASRVAESYTAEAKE